MTHGLLHHQQGPAAATMTGVEDGWPEDAPRSAAWRDRGHRRAARGRLDYNGIGELWSVPCRVCADLLAGTPAAAPRPHGFRAPAVARHGFPRSHGPGEEIIDRRRIKIPLRARDLAPGDAAGQPLVRPSISTGAVSRGALATAGGVASAARTRAACQIACDSHTNPTGISDRGLRACACARSRPAPCSAGNGAAARPIGLGSRKPHLPARTSCLNFSKALGPSLERLRSQRPRRGVRWSPSCDARSAGETTRERSITTRSSAVLRGELGKCDITGNCRSIVIRVGATFAPNRSSP